MSGRRVVVTGIGAITAAGCGADGLWQGVVEGRRGVRAITRFDARDLRSQIAAEIDGFDASCYMPAKMARRLDRFAQLAVASGRMAVDDAALPEATLHDAAVYVGSALGGIAFAEAQHNRFLTGGIRAVEPSLALAVFGGSGATALAMALDARGPALGNANSCASGAIAIGEAFRLVRAGHARVALAGGAEAPLAPLTFGAFTVIRAMSVRNDSPQDACRPFDAARDGFVMGEGAAVLALEALEHAEARGARIYAEVLGYGTTNDAYHVTAPRPDGADAARAICLALRDACVSPGEVSYVNAHGSGTPAGDRAEAAALRLALGSHASEVSVSGTKPLYGHPLGASGAIEASITALALRHGRVPPAVNFIAAEDGSPESGLVMAVASCPSAPEIAITNSFGFGGINACLALRRWAGR